MMALFRLSAYFPDSGLVVGCARELRFFGVLPGKYAAMSLSLSGAAGLLALAFSHSPAVSLFATAIIASLILAVPKMELDRLSGEIRAELPLFMRSLGMFLELGLDFQRALREASRGHGALSREMDAVLDSVRGGMGFRAALAAFASSFRSMEVKRAAAQMLSAYENGSDGSEIRKIGDELLSLEHHRLREHSARAGMFGLLLIASSAVLPTFFIVFAASGAFGGIGQGQMALAMLVLFPALSVLILLLARGLMPRSGFAGRSAIEPAFFAPSAAIGAGFLVPALSIPAITLGAAGGLWMAWKTYAEERRIEKIEEALPDAALSMSGMPASTPLERLFRAIEEGGFGPLSEEAGKSRRQLEMNVRPAGALADFAHRCGSGIVGRACRAISHMAETNTLDRTGALAEDIIRVFQLRRERAQAFAMQRYTLMLGAVLIPLIMKMALSLMEGMAGFIGAGASPEIASLIPPYIVIYSVIAGAAIADADGRRSALPLYSLGLAGAGIATFEFISF
ncbi:MAG: type II secretion system F family protein [Candidatus Micrarchaeota archaeon]